MKNPLKQEYELEPGSTEGEGQCVHMLSENKEGADLPLTLPLHPHMRTLRPGNTRLCPTYGCISGPIYVSIMHTCTHK